MTSQMEQTSQTNQPDQVNHAWINSKIGDIPEEERRYKLLLAIWKFMPGTPYAKDTRTPAPPNDATKLEVYHQLIALCQKEESLIQVANQLKNTSDKKGFPWEDRNDYAKTETGKEWTVTLAWAFVFLDIWRGWPPAKMVLSHLYECMTVARLTIFRDDPDIDVTGHFIDAFGLFEAQVKEEFRAKSSAPQRFPE